MIENRDFKVLTPVVDIVRNLDHVSLARSLHIPPLAQKLLPTALGQPSSYQKYLIQSLPDYFKMIFNPKLCLGGKDIDQVIHGQWQFLEQAVYDDLDFMSSEGI